MPADPLVRHREQVQALVEDQTNRAVVFLVTNNVPIAFASALNAVELEAWCIILSEINGRKFDFSRWEYENADR